MTTTECPAELLLQLRTPGVTGDGLIRCEKSGRDNHGEHEGSTTIAGRECSARWEDDFDA